METRYDMQVGTRPSFLSMRSTYPSVAKSHDSEDDNILPPFIRPHRLR